MSSVASKFSQVQNSHGQGESRTWALKREAAGRPLMFSPEGPKGEALIEIVVCAWYVGLSELWDGSQVCSKER